MRATASDASWVHDVLQHYVTDEQVAELAADSGIEVQASKLETLLAVADASAR